MQVNLHFLRLETSWVLPSRVRFMYEMQHFVHNFPPAPDKGLLRDFLIFSNLCRKNWNFGWILKFVGSNFEWVLTLFWKNRWVLTIRPSVYCDYSLVFQNPPVMPFEEVWKDPLKTEPKEVFGGSKTSTHKVFGRRGMCPRKLMKG